MMSKEPRITAETLKVLAAIGAGAGSASGTVIAKETRLASGTLYPILMRLERAGWVSSEWEVASPQDLGRPRRRFYRLTGKGAAYARSAAQDFQATIGRLAWS